MYKIKVDWQKPSRTMIILLGVIFIINLLIGVIWWGSNLSTSSLENNQSAEEMIAQYVNNDPNVIRARERVEQSNQRAAEAAGFRYMQK